VGAVSVSGCVATDVCDVITETDAPKVEDNAPENVDSLPTNHPLSAAELSALAQEQEQDPTLAPCGAQAQARKGDLVVHKNQVYYKDPVVCQSVCQLCVTQGTTTKSMLGTNHSCRKPRCYLQCSMSHGAYAVVLLCIFCVVLIVGVASCLLFSGHGGMFGNVLTPMYLLCQVVCRLVSESRTTKSRIFSLVNDNNFASCSMSSRNGSTTDPEGATRWCIKFRPPTGSCHGRCVLTVYRTHSSRRSITRSRTCSTKN